MELTNTDPVLLRVQVMVAGVGAVVGVVLVQPVKVNPAGGPTVKFTGTVAPVPTPGVAVKLPLYWPMTSPTVTLTLPQTEFAKHSPRGPLTVALAIAP